ncbi:hypothetical protein ACQKWADRAFT_307810 [Trichoderma austrokoningii]
MSLSESKYHLLGDDDESSQSSLDREASVLPRRRICRIPINSISLLWFAQILMLFTSVTFFTIATLRSSSKPTSIEPAYTQEYGPALRAVGGQYGWQLLGEFDQPSKWRGQPNKGVDEAWISSTHAGAFSITKEEVERMGKLTNSTIMLPASSGGGYMASLEATHQLHCVDLLRKFSYREYYADKSAPFGDPNKLRTHIDHCIEMLRQVIMCNGDLHIITYNWVDHVDTPWPDFSLNRQCRDWDRIIDWVGKRGAKTSEEHGLLRRPAGAAAKHVRPAEYVHVD